MKFVVYFIYKSLPLDQDGAEPCPNSVSVTNLVRLGTLLHRQDYLEKAGTIVKVFYERLTKIPVAVPEMVCGLIILQDTPKQVIYLIYIPNNGKSSAESPNKQTYAKCFKN